MFYSVPPFHDLIFQDSTRQLRVIEPSKRRWDIYVGADFLRARRITDCDSGSSYIRINNIVLTIASIIIFIKFY